MHAAAKAGQPAAHSVEECRGESTLRSSRTQRILITSIAIASILSNSENRRLVHLVRVHIGLYRHLWPLLTLAV
jgi:hypothetical protein